MNSPRYLDGMRADLGHDCCTADMMDRCNNSRCSTHGIGPAGSFDRYSALASRTIRADQPNDEQRVNAALGLTGEAGEVAELIKKDRFHGKPHTREQMCSELGDVLWYLNQMAYAYGLTLGEIADANIAKLEARYPDGFVPGGGIRK